ncbi:hypothetical protein BDB01DRAFT_897813 [Pilobolus umbonatus]|nr:hypothetical protein BDB01DRAFT_897813 [Pilobolus umbonatus]
MANSPLPSAIFRTTYVVNSVNVFLIQSANISALSACAFIRHSSNNLHHNDHLLLDMGGCTQVYAYGVPLVARFPAFLLACKYGWGFLQLYKVSSPLPFIPDNADKENVEVLTDFATENNFVIVVSKSEEKRLVFTCKHGSAYRN